MVFLYIMLLFIINDVLFCALLAIVVQNSTCVISIVSNISPILLYTWRNRGNRLVRDCDSVSYKRVNKITEIQLNNISEVHVSVQ